MESVQGLLEAYPLRELKSREPNEHLYLLLSGHPASTHAIAEDDCRALVIHDKTMWSLVNSSPAVALNILFVLAQSSFSSGCPPFEVSSRYVFSRLR